MKPAPNLFYHCSWKQLICQRLRFKKIRKSILERDTNQKSLSVTMPLFSLARDEGHVLTLSSLRSFLLNPLKEKWFSSKHPVRSDSERRSGLWTGRLLEGVLQLRSTEHKTINITAAFNGWTSFSALFSHQRFSSTISKRVKDSIWARCTKCNWECLCSHHWKDTETFWFCRNSYIAPSIFHWKFHCQEC